MTANQLERLIYWFDQFNIPRAETAAFATVKARLAARLVNLQKPVRIDRLSRQNIRIIDAIIATYEITLEDNYTPATIVQRLIDDEYINPNNAKHRIIARQAATNYLAGL